MDDKSQFIPLLALWGVAIGPLVFNTFRRPAAGLVLAYCFQMWMLYWLAASIHALPWSDLPDSDLVYLGFQQATIGILAFAAGALLAGPAIARLIIRKQESWTGSSSLDPKMPRKYILAGMVSYFILTPTIGQFPGMNAVPAVGSQLVVVGCCLRCWLAWHTQGKTALMRTLIPTMLIPIVILMKQGFLGFGVIAISIILIFTAQFFRPRWILAVGVVVSAYVGMTVYVTYMRDRDELRTTVWGEQSLTDRISQGWKTASSFDWFDPHDDDQLALVDGRLNQSVLVGSAVDNLTRTGDYLHGETLVDALLAMVPRLIWQNKPIAAGSAGLVTQLTGIEFAVGTSVGIGPVMEFYGNFGVPGVVAGFFIFGALVAALDFCSGVHLNNAAWFPFMMTFLVGIACLNVSGSLVEITAGAAASVVVAFVVKRILDKRPVEPQPLVESPA